MTRPGRPSPGHTDRNRNRNRTPARESVSPPARPPAAPQGGSQEGPRAGMQTGLIDALRADLQQGLDQLGLALSEPRQQQLLRYLALIARWSRVYNLTALREPGQMLTHHLLDCLAVVRPLQQHLAQQKLAQARLLDVGAGAGLPGVVLAICLPQLHVDCVDTVAKKAAFVQQVAGELALPNLRGLHARVEKLAQAPYDLVSSRAFSSLADLVQLTMFHVKPNGVWMAMKGKPPQDELAALPAPAQWLRTEPLQVPGLNAERCLVWLRRA